MSSVGDTPLDTLTPKMSEFARLVASGYPYSKAYAQAYSVENSSPATIRKEASKLAKDTRVRDEIVRLRADNSVSRRSQAALDASWVEKELTDIAKDRNAGANTRLRALELLGRASGLFSDDDRANTDPRSADEIKADLASKLAEFGLVELEGEDGEIQEQ